MIAKWKLIENYGYLKGMELHKYYCNLSKSLEEVENCYVNDFLYKGHIPTIYDVIKVNIEKLEFKNKYTTDDYSKEIEELKQELGKSGCSSECVITFMSKNQDKKIEIKGNGNIVLKEIKVEDDSLSMQCVKLYNKIKKLGLESGVNIGKDIHMESSETLMKIFAELNKYTKESIEDCCKELEKIVKEIQCTPKNNINQKIDMMNKKLELEIKLLKLNSI